MAGAEVLTCGDDGNRMLCACVDIGTNTTRLLVAERDDGAPARGRRRAPLPAPGPRSTTARSRPRRWPSWRRSWPRTCARPAAHGVARGARRGHGGDPRRAQPRRRCARRCTTPRASTSRSSAASRRRALAFAGALAHAGAPPGGRDRRDRRRRRLVGARDRDGRGRRHAGGRRCAIGSGTLAARHLHSDPPALDGARPPCAPRSTSRSSGVDRAAAEVVLRRRRQRDVAGGAAAASSCRATIARDPARPAAAPARRGGRSASGSPVERVRLLPAGMLLLEAACGAFGERRCGSRWAACARALCCELRRA